MAQTMSNTTGVKTMRSWTLHVVTSAALALLSAISLARAADTGPALPPPLLDMAATRANQQTAVFAGGCFWGVQGVFQHVDGVIQAVSGYAGGQLANPSYEQVSAGRTGHAESVRVTFDPARVSYAKLLRIFFTVALDPTEVNRQGPDAGPQYRSELFVDGPEQERVARAYVAQLEAAHVFGAPIATRIDPAGPFYPAEAYHQDYLTLHPDSSYIVANDLPKVRHLQAAFPREWRNAPVTVGRLASRS